MTPRRKHATAVAFAVMVVAAGSAPATPAYQKMAAGPSWRDFCGYEFAPSLSDAERAEVTRSATRAITILGSTDRRREYTQVAAGELLSDLKKRRTLLAVPQSDTTTEKVSAVTAVGVTSRCTKPGPYGMTAGQMSLMVAGRLKVTGVRPEPIKVGGGATPSYVQSFPSPGAPRPGQTIERVGRWTLTMVPTPKGWRVSQLMSHPEPDAKDLTVHGTVKSDSRELAPEEILLNQVAKALKEVYSYRLQKPAAAMRAAHRHLTGDALDQHLTRFTPIAARARQSQVDIASTLASFGIIRHAGGSATLMAFLNLEAVRPGDRKPDVLPSPDGGVLGPPGAGGLAVTITAARDDGRWRISGIHFLS